ncbi:MAG: EAL domain-containing protein [Deltaproteobacteria bacterium]|nr:EAL domain-containing protein [Deltaproteobacteria bacterium]
MVQSDIRNTLVLIIDDDSSVRSILSTGLSKIGGFSLVEAENGEAGFNNFLKFHPDVVLLDVVMPVMDGYETCRAIRESPGGELVPIIMITGQDDYESVNQAFEAGATDFVVKPINLMILNHRIRYILRANTAATDLRMNMIKLASAREITKFVNWEWNIQTDQLVWGCDACDMCGIALADAPVSFADFIALIPPDEQNEIRKIIDRALQGKNKFSFEHSIQKADGDALVVHQEGYMLLEAGRPRKIIFTCQDITNERLTEEKIKFLAYYDRLTGLPNRILFTEHLEKAIIMAKREGLSLSILYVDIDNFRLINDRFGRSAGDDILKLVSQRIIGSLRSSDVAGNISSHEITARFGADEFGVVVEGLKKTADAAIVARRIIEALTRAIKYKDHEIFLNCRVGISVFPDDGDTVGKLVKCVDSALSRAKELGKNSYQFYTADLNTRAFTRFAMETSLRKALDNNEFFLLYQPQVELAGGSVNGVEALIRWQHPELGLVSPIEFIPIAEETGQIVSIGEWVMMAACRQCKEWEDAGYNITIAINLSAEQLKDVSFISFTRQTLADTGANPTLIEFEITESMLMDNVAGSIKLLEQLRGFGSRLSIDDFGTGYSSLNYLKQFPVNELKIDRSFVIDLLTSKDDALIVKAVVALAHNLNLEVVAEGVEEKRHLTYLHDLGCDIIQGYLISKPLPVAEVTRFFKGWNIRDL